MKEGNRALEEGDAKAALDAYGHALERAPGAPEILFDSGLAKSAGGDPAAARESFLAALAGGGEELRGAIEYNVGNTYFAEKNYEAAAKAYRAALAVNPDDQDAKANLELTLRRIAEQKEKQQQQEQKQPQDQKQQGQQDQQPQKPDQGQSEKQDQPPKDDQQQGDSQQPSPDQKAGEPKPEQSPQTNDQSEQQQQARDRQQQDDHNNGQQQQAKPGPQGEPPNKDGGAGQEATAATQMDAQQVDQLLDALQSQEEQLQHQVRARLVPVAPRKLEQDW